MAASPLGLNLDFFLNGLIWNSRWSLPKCHISLSFLPYASISSFILAFFIYLGVGTNLSPFEKREISSLERCRLHKLIALALINFPSFLLLCIVVLSSSTVCSSTVIIVYSITVIYIYYIYIHICILCTYKYLNVSIYFE